MANSTSHLNLLSAGQPSKEVSANALFDAASPSMLYGRNSVTTAALTWGYYGGNKAKADGTIATIANGTVTLTASTTNYIYATDAGVVTVTTSEPTDWPAPLASDATALYEVATGTASVTSYTDWRTTGTGGGTGGGGGLTDAMVFKGAIDCSANPNYPAADAGDVYKVSVAGKIGGASGLDVLAGDTLYCTTDGTASGNHATVGSNWNVANENVTTATHGALISSATAKTTPADADMFGLMDSAASNIMKKLSWANIKTALNLLYAPLAQPYDVFAFHPGIPTNSAKMFRSKIPRAVTFAANFAGSQFTATANATGSSVFDIQKNGSSVGTCTIAAGGTTPTFASSGGAAVSFASGDVLEILCPTTADATLANPSITLVGTR